MYSGIPFTQYYLLRVLIVNIISYILYSILYFGLFKKAGIESSKAFIPYYRIYVLYKMIDLSDVWFWITVAVSVVNYSIDAFNAFVFINLGIFATVINVAILAVSIIYGILVADQLGNSFGKKTGFKVGYFFLPVIFGMILGFGKSKYIGPNGVKIKKKKKG